MPKPKILAFAGSTRTDSYNKKLIKVAAEAVTKAGGEVTLIDLRDYPMPLYDGDLEKEGMPENAVKLKALMLASDGFLISSPEYNSSISGVLKNAIDWASRKPGAEGDLSAYTGKTAALISASPGALGGLRGLVELRRLLMNINTIVIPQQLALSTASEAFAEDGSLKDAKKQQAIEGIAKRLVEVTAKLKA